MDAGISVYNSKYLTKDSGLDTVGGTVAAIVRGAGGIWIRHEQELAICTAVNRGDKVVGEMTGAIEQLAGIFITDDKTTDREESLFALFASELKTDFIGCSVLARSENRMVDLAYTDRVVAMLDRAKDAKEVTRHAIAAASKYRLAHRQLVNAINTPDNLKSLIEQIETLKQEIDAAKKLRKDISK